MHACLFLFRVRGEGICVCLYVCMHTYACVFVCACVIVCLCVYVCVDEWILLVWASLFSDRMDEANQ